MTTQDYVAEVQGLLDGRALSTEARNARILAIVGELVREREASESLVTRMRETLGVIEKHAEPLLKTPMRTPQQAHERGMGEGLDLAAQAMSVALFVPPQPPKDTTNG